MKTDLVEIFQTLRATLYPYQTRGYTVHENSDNAYELFSEKNREHNGEKITEFFFTGLYVEERQVAVKFNSTDFDLDDRELVKFDDITSGFLITQLDQQMQDEVGSFIEMVHVHFKKNEWV